MQRAVCATGKASDSDVQATAQASIKWLAVYGESCKLWHRSTFHYSLLQSALLLAAGLQAVMVIWGELMARKEISKDQQIPAFQQAINCMATLDTDSVYKNL